MNWEVIFNYGRHAWVLLIFPLWKWVDGKRKNYASLVRKVENLEENQNRILKKIDEDREERKETSHTIAKIYDLVKRLETDTAVNSAILKERK